MWKKIFSLVLALSILFCCAASAEETSVIDSNVLEKWAYTTDDYIYREYTHPTGSQSVTIQPGEYLIVNPIHWIDSNYLSYNNVSVTSSDENIVTASAYQPQQGRYADGAVSSQGSRQDMGIRLYGKNPGTAVVTINYSTFLTKMGLNYQDMRETPDFQQTIEVTVGSPLKMSLRIYSPSQGTNVGSILIRMGKLGESVQLGAKVIDLLTDFLPETDIGDAAESIGEAGAEIGFDRMTDLEKMDYTRFLGQIGQQIGKAWDTLKTNLDACKPLLTTLMKQYAWEALSMPTYDPHDLRLQITVENAGDQMASGIFFDIQGNSYLSLNSSFGPWGDSRTDFIRILEPGETVTLEDYPLFAKNMYGDASDPIPGRLAYTGSVEVSCRYIYEGMGNLVMQDTASIRAFSEITKEELEKLFRNYNSYPQYYKQYFWANSFWDLIYVDCPVELVLFDEQGQELAVIGTDDPEGYEEDGVLAGADGEAKYLLLSSEMKDKIQVKVRAVSDGTMDVYAYAYQKDCGAGANVYQEISLTAGEIFDVGLSETGAGNVYRLDENGQAAALEPVYVMNQETVLQELQGTDLSQWAFEPVSKAILHGLTSQNEEESFQNEASLEEFCEMLVNFYESYGGLTQSTADGEESPIEKAVKLGLLPSEYALLSDGERKSPLPVTCREAAEAVLACVDLLKLDQVGETESDETDERFLEKVRKVGFLADAEETVWNLEAPMTREQSIAVIYELWSYCTTIYERDNFIQKSVSTVLEGLEMYDPGWNGYQIRVSEEGHPEGWIGNFSFYSPTTWMVDTDTDLDLGLEELAKAAGDELLLVAYYLDMQEEIPKPLDSAPVLNGEVTKFTPIKGAQGCMETTDGTVYYWIPGYFTDDAGVLYDDNVYLYAEIVREGIDEEFLNEKGIDFQGNYRLDGVFLSDQQMIADYLTLIRPLLERAPQGNQTEQAETVEYPELSVGDSGSGVERLQAALIQEGYLNGSADGSYGNMTAEAVATYQAAAGLEATGVADSETQSRLFEASSVSFDILDWLERQS